MDKETLLRDDVWLVEKEAGWYLVKKGEGIRLATYLWPYSETYTPQKALEGDYRIGNLPRFKIYDKNIQVP